MADNRSRITKVGQHIIITDKGAFVTKAGAYVEILGDDLRISSAGAMVEAYGADLQVTSAGTIVEIIYSPEAPMTTYFKEKSAGPQSLQALSPEIVGYALDPTYSFWQIVVPKRTINYVKNPSFETNFDSYTAVAWTRVKNPSVGSRAGRYVARFAYDLSAGSIYYWDGQAVPAGVYTFSCWVYSEDEFEFTLRIYDGGAGVNVAVKKFKTRYTGWHRYEITGAVLAPVVFRCYLEFDAGQTRGTYVYTDAWQFENDSKATTYVDGDMEGFNEDHAQSPYYWLGIPHDSESIRLETTRSGGVVHSLSDNIKFLTTGIIGLGMSPIELNVDSLSDGSEIYRGAFFKSRQFTIVGRLYGKDYMELDYLKSLLIDYLKPDLTENRQPMIIRYAPTDLSGDEIVGPVEIVAAYRQGLEGNVTNWFTESIPLQFYATVPQIRGLIRTSVDVTVGQDLDPTTGWIYNIDSVNTLAGGLVERGWTDFGGGATAGTIFDAAWYRDGTLLAAGSFTQIAGSAALENVAEWDAGNNAWANIGGVFAPTTPLVCEYGKGPLDKTPVLYGQFTTVDANVVRRAAIYDRGTATWNEISNGLAGGISSQAAIVPTMNGDIFFFGGFLTDGPGVQTFNYAAQYDYSAAAWVGMGVGAIKGLSNVVHDATLGSDGNIYVVGIFTDDANGTFGGNLGYVCRFSTTGGGWERMGDGVLGPGAVPDDFRVASDSSGNIYVSVTRAVSPLNEIYRWNGASWSLFYEFTQTRIHDIAVDANDRLHVLGDFTTDSGGNRIQFDPMYMVLQGNVPSNGGVSQESYGAFVVAHKVITDSFGRVALVKGTGAANGQIRAVSITNVVNNGSTEAFPIIHIHGPGEIRVLRNASANTDLQFRDGFVMGDTEEVTIDLSGQRPRMYSNLRSNVQRFLLPGLGSIRKWRLLPGNNNIEALILDDTAATEIWLEWRDNYWSIASSGGMLRS